MAVETKIIKIRRGLESDLDASKLLIGEFGFTTDTKKLFIGTASGAKELAFCGDISGDISGNITDEQIQEAVNKYLEENPIVSSNLYMRVDSGYIQFSQDNKNWKNVIALSDLKGEKGNDGVGIQTVEQTTTSSSPNGSNVITVTLTNGQTATFTVKNGPIGATGAPGVGIQSVEQTVTSEASGGRNTVEVRLSNGNKSTFYVYNGKDGVNGAKGETGVGIKSVKQTTTSTEDSGKNVVTVTLTNGSTAEFTVKNGSKGSKGDAGSDASVTSENIKTALGYLPAKQTDVKNIYDSVNAFGGTVEVTSNNVQKEKTVLAINPNSDTVNIYSAEEVDSIVGEIADDADTLKEYLGTPPKAFLAIAPFEKVDGKLFELAPKKEFDRADSCYTKTEIPDDAGQIKVSGKSASAVYGYGIGAFYDANWNHIENIPSEDNTEYVNLLVDVPENAKYIVVNFKEMKDRASSILALTVYPISQEIEDTEKRLDYIESNFIKPPKVSLNFTLAGYLEARPSDGSFIRWLDSDISRSTDYEKCTGYEKLKVELNGNEYMWQVAFYDENKVFMPNSSVVGNRDTNAYSVNIPSTATYVRVCTYNINQITPKAEMIPAGSVDEKVSELEDRVSDIENNKGILDGCEFALFKKWGLISDSLSVGHTVSADGTQTLGRNIYYSWGQYLARRIGNTCLNFGASGLSAKTWMSSEYGYHRLVKSENLCQCYVVGLGANDTAMTVGSISDINFSDMSKNADTVYGWYAKVLNTIRNVSSDAPIFLLTLAYPRNNDYNAKAINEMVRILAADSHFNKVFVMDLDKDYNDYFSSGKLFNQIGNTGWHLTSLGYLYTSKVIENGLSKVIADNYGAFQDVFLLPCGTTESLE